MLPAATAAPAYAERAQSDEGSRLANQPLPPGAQLREEFADTAYWIATILTDRSGRATVTVSLPDNLTTWVFRGVGVTSDTRVGDQAIDPAGHETAAHSPVAPRFFVAGDRVELAALVSNNTGASQDVTVTLTAEGLTLEDPAEQNVTIADKGEQRITWWITADDVETASIVMSAVADEYADAARPRLTTVPDGTSGSIPLFRSRDRGNGRTVDRGRQPDRDDRPSSPL